LKVALVVPPGIVNVAVVVLVEIVTGAVVAGFAPTAAIVTVDGKGSAVGLLVVNVTSDEAAIADMSFSEQLPVPPGATFTGVQASEDSAPGINKLIGIDVEVPFNIAAKLATKFDENVPALAVNIAEK
jgi:hypothetical protein